VKDNFPKDRFGFIRGGEYRPEDFKLCSTCQGKGCGKGERQYPVCTTCGGYGEVFLSHYEVAQRDIRKKYRIVSNGVEFRVQVHKGWWIFKRWTDLCNLVSSSSYWQQPISFSSQYLAETALRDAVRRELRSIKMLWKPINGNCVVAGSGISNIKENGNAGQS